MSTVVETREDSTKQQKKKGNKKQEEEEVQDDGVYEVEKIIGHRIYKVRKNFPFGDCRILNFSTLE